jgi:ankyrin repeat protein
MQNGPEQSDENQWGLFDRLFAWRHSDILSAAYAGNRYAVHQFLTNDPNGLEAQDGYQQTPLHLAASMGHVELVKDLINWGANI